MFKVKEWLSDKDDVVGLYDVWNSAGAFVGKEESRNLAFTKKTEELAEYLSIRCDYSEVLTNIVFAIVVRAYFIHDYIFESCPDVIVFISNHTFMIAEIRAADPKTDAEAEFCAKMAKSITDLNL
jgi:hypothetical protein